MFDDLLEQAVALKARGEPFVLATVVSCRPPTSAKPGAKAIVKANGAAIGWVGGSCARPLVTQEALKALSDGQPRLLFLSPTPGQGPDPRPGVLNVAMACQSEGSLEIYLEPFLPKRQLLIIGQSPVAQGLAALGKALGFAVSVCDPSATAETFPDADSIVGDLETARERLGPHSFVVVATMGHYDEEALAAAVYSPAPYVGLIASPKRGKAVLQYLRDKGVPAHDLARVKYPAGLDIGAQAPEEIALSILSEIVQIIRSKEQPSTLGPPPERLQATDPVCGMTVIVEEARYLSSHGGQTFYFCCLHCQETFDQDPDRYLAQRAKG